MLYWFKFIQNFPIEVKFCNNSIAVIYNLLFDKIKNISKNLLKIQNNKNLNKEEQTFLINCRKKQIIDLLSSYIKELYYNKTFWAKNSYFERKYKTINEIKSYWLEIVKVAIILLNKYFSLTSEEEKEINFIKFMSNPKTVFDI